MLGICLHVCLIMLDIPVGGQKMSSESLADDKAGWLGGPCLTRHGQICTKKSCQLFRKAPSCHAYMLPPYLTRIWPHMFHMLIWWVSDDYRFQVANGQDLSAWPADAFDVVMCSFAVFMMDPERCASGFQL